ncbi:RdRP [Anopheles marajoara virus]|uniref:Replicase n=1 Tax=Anopheles marajoara virus TaxID=2546225 RepID=A0AAE5YIA0_9MONO|nr:RdRP [Anopheles marajoara virus]QBK47216.1 RdRP [Anopheles marajoara virus]
MSDELFTSDTAYEGDTGGSRGRHEEGEGSRGDVDDTSACISGHLSQPIYGGEVDMLLTGGIKWLCYRHRKLSKVCAGCFSFREYPRIYDDIEEWLSCEYVGPHEVTERVAIIVEGSRNVPLQRAAFCYPARDIVPLDTVFKWSKEKNRVFHDRLEELHGDLRTMIKIEKFKDTICFKEIKRGQFIEHRGGQFEQDISIIPIRGKRVVLPTTLLMCCADKMQSLFGLKLYWLLTDIYSRYPGLSILGTGSELIDKFRKLRRSKLEGFFAFAASWEPLIVGDTIAQPDDEGDTGLFMNQVESMQVYLDSTDTGLNIFHFLPPRGCGTSQRRMWLELTGIVKIFGYPILKERMLLDQLKEHGVKAHPDFSFSTLNDTMGLIKRDFVINYREKTGKFPKFLYCPDKILDFINRDEVFPKKLTREYRLWNEVVFDKTLEFDYVPDPSELSKDSACAVPLSQWPSMYDKCAYMFHYGKPMPLFAEKKDCYKRVIMAFLNAEEDKIRKSVRKIENLEFDPENKIIVQCGKELEQKEDTGRAFTKQTADQRYLQVTMEMNIAESIFKFVPEQSMTDGEVALANRQMAQYKELGGLVDFISMDLTKWCLNHRSVMVEDIGKMYDDLFGLNGLYKTSHDFFVHCNVFVNSRMCPPDYDDKGNPIPGDFFMNNFVGGCEGLHQKKWTHLTIGIIKLALERTDIQGTLMGQGDNQIVMLHYDKSEMENRDRIRKSFLSQCERLFISVGHKLKRQETWYSSQLHEYGKLRMYKGMTVSQGTKKSTKLIPDINDGLFAISSSISTINTLTEAIAKGNQDADVAFTMNQVLLANFLHRRGIVKSKQKKFIVRLLLLYPTDFGGISLSTFHSHSVRGHDDPVTLWLALYYVIRMLDDKVFLEVMKCVTLYPSSPALSALDRTRLMEDPHCLRVSTLPTANRKISEFCLKYLKSDHVTNPAIKRLYKTSVSMDYNNLIEALDKMQPLYVSLANVLLKNSNAGIGMLLQGKFTSVKSIEMASKEYGKVSLIDLISDTNARYVSALQSRLYRANFLRNLEIFAETDCPTKLADILRKMHWNKDLVGVTKPPHTHQVRMVNYDHCPPEMKSRSVLIKLSSAIREKNLSGITSFGPYSGYVGSRTKVKVKPPSTSIMEKTSYSKGLQVLGRTMTWMLLYQNVGLASLCKDLMKEKLAELPDSIAEEDLHDTHETVMSGNPFHRLMSQVESTTSSINGMITVTSHFSQSSNLMQNLSREGEDYTIFFQYVYSADIAVLASLISISDLPPAICAVLECETCTYELPEPKFEFNYDIKPNCESLQEFRIEKKEELMSEDLSLPFAVAIGEEVARNVDENSRLNHGHGTYSRHGVVIKTTKISINDFKRLDLVDILCSMIVHSRHCSQLITEFQEGVMSESNDLSFCGLANLIMESNTRERLFEIVDRGASQHTMITQSERMSAYISQNLLRIFCRLNDHIVRSILPIEFKTSSEGWRYKVFRRLSQIYDTLSIPYNKKVYKWGVRRRATGVITSAFGVRVRRYPIEMHEVVQYWRPNPTRSPVIIESDRTVLNHAVVDYPIDIVTSFRTLMSNNYNQGCLSYDFLAFLARPILNLSSAASKYIEIICMLGVLEFFKNDPCFIVSLAEGSAGTFDTMLDLFPLSKGTYNTMIEPETDNRQTATDNAPPASVVSGNLHRWEDHGLSTGETNITKIEFLRKLEKCLDKKVGTNVLMTMDAESMNRSDNINHVENLLPIIEHYQIRLSILKLFLSPRLLDFLEAFMSSYTSLDWTIFKPISSNPLSHEIFLIVMPKGRSNLLKVTRDNMRADYAYLMIDEPRMTDKGLSSFLYASAAVYHMFMRMYLHSIRALGDKWVPHNACGLLCVNTLHSYISTARLVENSTHLQSVRVLIRAGGQLNTLLDMINRIVFLATYLSTRIRSFELKLSQLSSLTVSKQNLKDHLTGSAGRHIVGINFFGGNYLKNWGDIKFFTRHVHGRPCTCSPIRPTYMPEDGGNCIIRRVLLNLFSLNLIHKNEFLSIHDFD